MHTHTKVPLLDQEQADAYLVVAALVEQRLVSGREESLIYDAVATRNRHLTQACTLV